MNSAKKFILNEPEQIKSILVLLLIFTKRNVFEVVLL